MRPLLLLSLLLSPCVAAAQCGPDGMDPVCGGGRKAQAPAFLYVAGAAGCQSSLPASGGTPAITRASSGTVMTSATTMATCTSGQFRVDYRGLEIEESRTNVALRSQEIDNSYWGKYTAGMSAPVVTANQAAAPDGTTTADQVALPAVTAANTLSFFEPASGISPTTGVVYSWSLWERIASGSSTNYIGYDGASKTQGAVAVTTSTTWARTSTSLLITSGQLGGGSQLYPNVGIDLRTGSGDSPVASGQTVFMWGAQCEIGPFPTSYIATMGTAVSRAADQIDVGALTLSATPSISATVNLEGLPASGTATVLRTTDGTTPLTLAIDTSGHAKCTSGASSDTTTGALTPGTATKVACKYDGTTLSACLGGTCHGTAASLSLPSAITHTYLGWDGSGSYLDGFVSTACADKSAGCAP